jgi:tripartite motif-containing protein 71
MMSPLKKTPVKKAAKKKGGKKGIGKGTKIFMAFFGLVLLTVLLLILVSGVNKALIAAKAVTVQTDLEIGGDGEGEGQFREPWGIALDQQGNFYVTDFNLRRVQKFDPTGKVLLTFGKPGKEEGEFDQPSGIYVDPSGNIYVCDTFNHRIQKFDPEGNVLKVWNHSFFGPRSIVGNSQGRLYVSDTGNHKIKVFDSEGNFLSEIGDKGTTNGKFQEPMGLAVDLDNNLYVADSDNRRIQKFDSNGKFLSAFKVDTWRGKNDEVPYLAIGQGFLYASNASEQTVLKYTLSGSLVAICKKGDKEGFSMATGVAVDSQNRVYVVEKHIEKVARFTIPVASPKK